MIPDSPLDVLAQQIVAACVMGGASSGDDGWDEWDEMFALVRRAYPYRDLARATFDSLLKCSRKELPHDGGAATELTFIATA